MSEVSPRASRLATPRWLDGRLVFGVVLVLLAVVAGARVFATADRFTPVYVAAHPLVPGEQVRSQDFSVGRVRFTGNGGAYIAATGAPPIGYRVTRYVGAGELVPIASLSTDRGLPVNDRLVTIPVEPGHLPDDLGHGDLVDLYLTAKRATGDAAPLPTKVQAAVPVDSYDDGSRSDTGGSTVSVVLDVPVSQVPIVVRALEGGTLDVVRVPPEVAAATPMPATTPTAAAASR